MRRHLTTTLTGALLLTLISCGTADNPPATPSDKGGSEAATARPTTSPEQRLLTDVKAAAFESWKTEGPSDAELTAYPPQWCAEFKGGHGVAYVLDSGTLYPIGQTWGTAKADAQELVVLAVTAYCPEYRDQVTKELRDSGAY
ncbi:hypothetical protein ACPB9E_36405 [Streptomyces exfoliatus]|uniref:hypothetical protein n=1 Tax=Streptomyces exfoliatus TaxID=1905 RepID=UPI003C2F4380